MPAHDRARGAGLGHHVGVDAVGAALRAAARFGLQVSKPVLLRDTNNVVVWLAPEPVVVKVGREPRLLRERGIAAALADAGAPVVGPAPRLPREVHKEGGHAMTFWVHIPDSGRPPPGTFASALATLHQHLGRLPASRLAALPRFTHVLDESLRLLSDPRQAPRLAELDRRMLRRAAQRSLATLSAARSHRVLHGAPHSYNVLVADQVLFIDFETVCWGPIEWDLAHQPDAVAAAYPAPLDMELLDHCRVAASVKTAAFCWADAERGDLREHAEFHTALLRRLVDDRSDS